MNESLTDLAPLSNITSVGQSLIVWGNPGLINLDGR